MSDQYPDWLNRVVEEKKELDAKVQKLRAFDTSNLSDTARNLLRAQEGMMTGYSNVLQQRIALWERENKAKA